MKTYTYNKSTVWFLSTPIQYLLLGTEQRPLLAKRFFFCFPKLFALWTTYLVTEIKTCYHT